MKTEMDSFIRAYIQCALWSSNDDEGEPFDSYCDESDLAPETLAQFAKDCDAFRAANADDISKGCTRGSGEYSVYEQAAHDFWLTRNGHGAGFWDGDWLDDGDDDARARRLTDAAHAFGNVDLYIADDGLIYSP